jgi:hypothetical protein
MTTPVETMEWLDLQFRARANEDGEAHTAQDADQVEAARAAFNDMLAALRELTAWAYGELAGRLAPEPVAAAKSAIAAAEGRETTDARKAEPEHAALAALRQMRDAYGPLHDAVSEICEGEIWSEERRAALADLLDPACNAADHLAETVLAGKPTPMTAVAPAKQCGTPVIPVDVLEWQEIGEEGQPKARLLAALQIGDCMFHVEAREIDPDSDPQSTLECGDDLDRFANIAGQSDFVFILPYEA